MRAVGRGFGIADNEIAFFVAPGFIVKTAVQNKRYFKIAMGMARRYGAGSELKNTGSASSTLKRERKRMNAAVDFFPSEPGM